MGVEKGLGGEDHAGDAVATLHRLFSEKGLLHAVQSVLSSQPFDGDDLLASRRRDRGAAGRHGAAIEEYGAGAALALSAAVLRPGQTEILAQDLEQGALGFGAHLRRLTVDRQREVQEERQGGIVTEDTVAENTGADPAIALGRLLVVPAFVCLTCGVQVADSPETPAICAVCEDERQFVGWNGQQWATPEDLRRRHDNHLEALEENLFSLETRPGLGIGQRALVVRSPEGNVMWDCTFLGPTGAAQLKELGGLAAIAISHPHFYSVMVEWSEMLGDVPIYLHAADREWVQRPDDRIVFWEGESHSLGPQIELIRCGGHFAGGSVLHWSAGAAGRGALLTGDILQVVQDRRWVSFMYSYPNLIPLSAARVRSVVAAVSAYDFDRIYGAWPGRVVEAGARGVVERSAERYIRALAS